jgi:hypothetical protein
VLFCNVNAKRKSLKILDGTNSRIANLRELTKTRKKTGSDCGRRGKARRLIKPFSALFGAIKIKAGILIRVRGLHTPDA